MLYNLTNPSDKITFEAANREAAIIAVLMVGSGMYGATAIDEDGTPIEPKGNPNGVPLGLGQDLDKYTDMHIGQPLKQSLENNREAVKDALWSFVTGGPKERRLYERIIVDLKLTPEQQATLAEGWDDVMRSSMNEITNRAHDLASRL